MLSLWFFVSFLVPIDVQASVEEVRSPFSTEADQTLFNRLPPEEIYKRTQAVLDYFEVPPEPDTQDQFHDLDLSQTSEGLRKILPHLDLRNQFSRFFETQSKLTGFIDRDSKNLLDFEVRLANSEEQIPLSIFDEHLKRAKLNPTSTPLKGLRIALDPGHMGGNYYDHLTGKFVRDGRGHTLSEGVLNLQTAVNLEKEFLSLGAEVFITHRQLDAVTDLHYESFDIRPFAQEELRLSSLEPWFQNLLATAPPGTSLYQAFLQNSSYKWLYTAAARDRYFISRADLDARVQSIQDFEPDLTLVIHYDTVDPPGNPNGIGTQRYSKTKTYVTGGFEIDEFGSRQERAYFARHLLDSREWNASLKLCSSVVNELHRGLSIDYDVVGGGSSKVVVPGVFARNLVIPRKLKRHAVTYIECLHYNDPVEFKMLSANYPNSPRLQQVVTAIKNGVLTFVKNY